MLADILHQALNDQKRNNEGNHRAYDQHGDFIAGDAHTGEHKLQQFDGRSTQHGGDCHEEGELRAGGAANTQQNGTQNGGTGPGGTGHQAQTLERTDEQSCLVVRKEILKLEK